MYKRGRRESSCGWLKKIERRRAMQYCFVFSMMLNIYFLFISKTTKNVYYDNIDHRNAADAIRYSQCQFDGKPMIMKEIEWDKVNHIHSSCLCGMDHILSFDVTTYEPTHWNDQCSLLYVCILGIDSYCRCGNMLDSFSIHH